MNFFAFSGLFNGITATAWTILVFLRAPNDLKHQTYGLFGASVALWSYFYFAWAFTQSQELALLFVRFLMAPAIFIPVLYLHHVLILVDQVKQNKNLLISSYVLGGIFFLSNFTSLLVADVGPQNSFPIWPKPGIFFHFLLPWWIFLVIYTVYLLGRICKKTEGTKRIPYVYITVGTVIGYLGGTTNFPLWYGIQIPPYGTISTTIYITFTAYALLRELELTNEQLKELDRLKSDFISKVSHDLKTPLTSIKGFVDNLLEGVCGPLSEKQQTYLSRVRGNTDRLARMITDLLDLTSIEANKITMHVSLVNLQTLVSEVVDQLEPLAKDKNQSVEIIGSNQEINVMGDNDRLTQVFTNLMSNAIKFSPYGGVIRVEMGQYGSEFAKIAVIDSGPGIDQEAIPKLFDSFFQAQNHKQGLGLGLAIAKNFVELHKGTIHVESQVGNGSSFFVALPLYQNS